MKSIYILTLVAALFMFGCATTSKVQFTKTVEAALQDGAKSEQSIKDITIIVSPLDVSKELQNEEKYKKSIPVYYKPFLSEEGLYATPMNLDFYYGTTPFEVTVVNNTDHILRMKDSRIAFIDPALDEPIMGLDVAAISEDVTLLPAYAKTNDEIAKLKPLNNNHKAAVETELKNIAKSLKFVNAFNREILPGMRFSGIVVIPVSPEKMSEGKLSFIDMVSKTDSAGNPIERVRFDYRVQPVEKYWKLDPTLSKTWISVTKEEFDMGLVPKPNK